MKSAGSVALSIVSALAALWSGAAPAVAAPGCAADNVARQAITIAVDGEQASGWAYEPYYCEPGDRPARQLIVAVHGFNEKSGDYPDVMAAIARRGGATLLTLDQRGAQSRWKTGEWNPWAGWHDVVAAAEQYKQAHRSVARTVLWGWSQGGMTSGLALAHGPRGLFDYWVNTAGPSNAVDYWNVGNTLGLPQLTQIERDAGDCSPTQCPQAYRDRSTAALAAQLSARRSFLVHGTADPIVPYQHSLDLKAALVAAGRPYSMYTIVTGRGPDGVVLPGTHWIGPVWFEGACVVERILTDREPMDRAALEYTTDVLAGVDTAPPAPPGATCAG